jgi:hypothetical protein
MEATLKTSSKLKKYLQAMYSQESELNHVQDLETRKKKACEVAGMPWTAEATQEIVNLKNEEVNSIIFDFLTRENPLEYVQLITDQQLFYDLQKKKLLGDTKAHLFAKQADEMLPRIKAAYQTIYKEKEIMQIAEKRIRRMTPEQRIRARMQA